MKKLLNYFGNGDFSPEQRSQSLPIPYLTKYLLLFSMSLLMLEATTITISPEQQKDWQIKTATPTAVNSLVLGEFMAEVTTPPQHLHSISLPFEAQVKKLYVATYDHVNKGQLLAEVTGRDWINIQQEFIADVVELNYHKETLKRKNRLCNEGIIPKKEFISANAEHQADKIKVSTSKALLRGYGASSKMINDLVKKLKISPIIQVRSDISGTLLHLNVRSGKSTNPSDALFVIQKKGALWLEADILVQKAMMLKNKEKVTLSFNSEKFESTVLLHAPTINPENQTQKVRFSLPNSAKFLSGMRSPATITQMQKSVKVAKKSLISIEGKEVVFLKIAKGYESMEVEIVGEEGAFYFLKDMPQLHAPIATTSLLILKSLMEGEDE
jgi:cobalt-zinc-cadmium efflux system membrane fusion protein